MSNDFLLVFFISPNDCPDECGVWLGLRVGFAAIFVSALFYALFIYFFKFQIMQNEFQKYKAPEKMFRVFEKGKIREIRLSDLCHSPEIQGCEFTEWIGMFDKNNIRVFEGDVVRVAKNCYSWHWDSKNNNTASEPTDDDFRVGVVIKDKYEPQFIVAGIEQPKHVFDGNRMKYLESVEFYSDGNNDWYTISASDFTYCEVIGNVFTSPEFTAFRDIYSFFIV